MDRSAKDLSTATQAKDVARENQEVGPTRENAVNGGPDFDVDCWEPSLLDRMRKAARRKPRSDS